MLKEITQAIQNNKDKITLILKNDCIKAELLLELKHKIAFDIIYINIPEIHSIDYLDPHNKYLFIFDNFAADNRFENIWQRYELDRFNAQLVVICQASLLRHYYDPSLYFVPFVNKKLQKKLLIKFEIPSIGKNTYKPQSKLFQAKLTEDKIGKKSTLGLNDHFFNQTLMTKDAKMMRQLADRIKENKAYKQFLFKFIDASRDTEKLQIAAANVITGLNYAKVPFSGRNFGYIRIPHADLSGAILDNCNFENADTSNVIMRNSWVRETNFNNTNMESVDFGQQPNITIKHEFYDCCFSPNGKYLAIISREDIYLYDVKESAYVRTFEAHVDTILGISFIENDIIISGGKDGTVCRWDITKTKPVKTFSFDIGEIKAFAFSANKNLLVVAGNKTLFINMQTGESLYTFGRNFSSLAISGDGNIVAASQWGDIYLFDTTSGKQIRSITLEDTEIYGDISTIAMSPSGKYLAVVCGKSSKVSLYYVANGELYRILTAPRYDTKKIIFTADSEYIAWGSEDGVVRLWDVETGGLFRSFEGHSEPIVGLAISPDTHYLAAGARALFGAGNRTVRIWEIYSKHDLAELSTLKTHNHKIEMLSYSEKYKLLATQSVDAICLWKIDDGQRIHLFKKGLPTNRLTSVAFHPSGDYLVIGGNDLWLWDIATDSLIRTITNLGRGFLSLAFSEDGKTLAAGTVSSGPMIINMETGELIRYFKAQGIFPYTAHVEFYHNDEFLKTSDGYGNKISLWEVSSGKFIKNIEIANGNAMSKGIITADGNYIIYSNFSLHVNLIDVNNNNTMVLKAQKSLIRSFAYFKKENYLAVGCEDGSILVWDITTKKCIGLFEGQVNGVLAMEWIETGEKLFLASCGDDRTLRFLEVQSLQNNQLKLILRWATQQKVLVADRALIGSAIGLSNLNQQLLQQCNALKRTSPHDLFTQTLANQEILTAVESNDVDKVKHCLALGADPNIYNDDGKTLVRICVENDFAVILALLIVAEADIGYTDIANNSLLHYAIKSQFLNITQQLLSAGISPNKANFNKARPMHLAIKIAVENNDTAFIRVLLEHGADPNLSLNKTNETVLLIATAKNWPDIVKLCLANLADVNATTSDKISVMHMVAISGNFEIFQMLIQYSPHLDVQDGDNQTPLHCAVKVGSIPIIIGLLSNGANRDLVDKNNHTPFDIAINKKSDIIIEIFLSDQEKIANMYNYFNVQKTQMGQSNFFSSKNLPNENNLPKVFHALTLCSQTEYQKPLTLAQNTTTECTDDDEDELKKAIALSLSKQS